MLILMCIAVFANRIEVQGPNIASFLSFLSSVCVAPLKIDWWGCNLSWVMRFLNTSKSSNRSIDCRVSDCQNNLSRCLPFSYLFAKNKTWNMNICIRYSLAKRTDGKYINLFFNNGSKRNRKNTFQSNEILLMMHLIQLKLKFNEPNLHSKKYTVFILQLAIKNNFACNKKRHI